MISILLLGFLLGMRHALEADYLAAIASLATRTTTVGEAMRQEAVWGLGHRNTLILFGSLAIWLDAVFALGSILGMALLSIAITLPLSCAACSLNWLHSGLQAIIGTATLALGALMLLVV